MPILRQRYLFSGNQIKTLKKETYHHFKRAYTQGGCILKGKWDVNRQWTSEGQGLEQSPSGQPEALRQPGSFSQRLQEDPNSPAHICHAEQPNARLHWCQLGRFIQTLTSLHSLCLLSPSGAKISCHQRREEVEIGEGPHKHSLPTVVRSWGPAKALNWTRILN